MTTEVLVFNNQRFPFKEKLIRQALIAEIYNRNKIYRCMNSAEKAYGLIPNGIGGSIANLAPKQLLEITPEDVFKKIPQLKNNFYPVTIHRHSALKNDCEDNELIDAAKKYHINVKLQYHQDYSKLTPLSLTHNLDGFIEFFDIKSREAYTVLQFFVPSSSENYSNTKDKKIDLLLAQALTASSSHERFQGYQVVNKYLLTEGVIDPYYYVGHSNMLNKCLVGIDDAFNFNPYHNLQKIYRKYNCIS